MTATWDDVAAALPVDIRTLARYRKRADAPRIPDVPMWLAWRDETHAKRQAAQTKTAPPPLAPDAELPGECDYDALVKAGKISYETAKEREQVIGIAIGNQAKRLENEKARGDMVSKSDAERAAALVRDAVSQKYDRAILRALPSTPGIDGETRDTVISNLQIELDAE
jgi:hypothetical protein